METEELITTSISCRAKKSLLQKFKIIGTALGYTTLASMTIAAIEEFIENHKSSLEKIK